MSEVNLAVGSVRVMRSLDIEDGEIKIAPENDRSRSKMSEQIVFSITFSRVFRVVLRFKTHSKFFGNENWRI